jgi:hypothetical protein
VDKYEHDELIEALREVDSQMREWERSDGFHEGDLGYQRLWEKRDEIVNRLGLS